MARTPKKPADAETAADVEVEFTDVVLHDGQEYGPGDRLPLPPAVAAALIEAKAAVEA